MMEHVTASGKGDLISMCPSFIPEPDLIKPWLSGDTSPSQCDSCDGCLRASKRSEKFQCVVTIRVRGTHKNGA